MSIKSANEECLRRIQEGSAVWVDVRLARDRGSELIDHSLSPRRVGGVTASQHPRAAATYRKLFRK